MYVFNIQSMTDVSFGMTADLQVKHHTEFAPTYFYVYNYVSDNVTIVPEFMGELNDCNSLLSWSNNT